MSVFTKILSLVCLPPSLPSLLSADNCSASAFPIDLSGKHCPGLYSAGRHTSSVAACIAACCVATSCEVYQWWSVQSRSPKQGHRCWIGLWRPPCTQTHDIVSAARSSAIEDITCGALVMSIYVTMMSLSATMITAMVGSPLEHACNGVFGTNREPVVITYVRDEVDVVGAWVHYHASLFGYKNIVVVDNNSGDGTWEVLQELAKRHGIEVARHDDYKKKGDVMLQNMRQRLSRNKHLDYVIPLDVDEFLVRVSADRREILSRRDVCSYFKTLPKQRRMYKMNYLEAQGVMGAQSFFRYNTYCESKKCNAKSFFSTLALPREIDHGNHMKVPGNSVVDIRHEDSSRGSVVLTELCLIHYHARTRSQVFKKSINNWLGLGYPLKLEWLMGKKKGIPNGVHYMETMKNLLQGKFSRISEVASGSGEVNGSGFAALWKLHRPINVGKLPKEDLHCNFA